MYSTFELWRAAANAQLLRSYGISFADAGADAEELARYYAAHLEHRDTLKTSCDEYAEDRDLYTPDPMTVEDLRRMYPAPAEPDAAFPA